MHFNTQKISRYKILICVLWIILFFASSASAGGAQAEEFIWPTGPTIHAKSGIVMEASTGLILYEKDIYTAYFPASITKIMTALLALENCSLDETITMSYLAEWDVDFDSSRIGLVEGEQISLEDGLYAVLLESANEVSYCVGEHTAGGGIDLFSEMMNQRAHALGCVNTNFTNPHGLHDDNHYTCAYDMALISQAAIAIPAFQTITGTRTWQIPATNKNVSRYLANHHRFIRKTLIYDSAIGGKTGGTEEAKTTLVTFAKRNGLLLVAVVLQVDAALDAYEDTAAMLDFAFDTYASHDIIQTEASETDSFPAVFDYGPFFQSASEEQLLYIRQDSKIILPKTADFHEAQKTITFVPADELIHGENVIGTIRYTYKDKYVGAADIIFYNPDYPITKEMFDKNWPSFLVYPEPDASEQIAGSFSSLMEPGISDADPVVSDRAVSNRFVLHKTAFVFSVVVFLLFMVLIFFVCFYKKK